VKWPGGIACATRPLLQLGGSGVPRSGDRFLAAGTL